MADLSNIAVVGVSLAGVRGAEELRRSGYKGKLTMIGAEAHFPPYDRPPLSKEVLSAKWTLEEARLKLFEELDADMWLSDPAVGADLKAGKLKLQSGAEIGFDGLMVATGANVRKLRVPGADLPGVMYFRDAEHPTHLQDKLAGKPRIAIIGAGFIGLEVAAVCRGIGIEVAVIDIVKLPMELQVGAEIAKHVMQQHLDNGVTLHLGVGVTAIEGDGKVEGVRLSDGTLVPADVVIVGVGVIPATEFLEGTGVKLDGGVVCDQHCRAEGAANVVAAGDVARWFNPFYGRLMRVEHWTNAVEQAEYAAHTLLGEIGAGYKHIPYFWSDQYEMHIQFAGEKGDSNALVDGSIADGKFVIEYRKGDQPCGVLTVNWAAQFMRRRRALAAAAAAAH